MTNLVDEMMSNSRPPITHKRHAIQEYAIASEALLRMENFSKDEKDYIRQSVSSITQKVLSDKTGAAQ